MFIIEISPPTIRGSIGVLNQFYNTVGVLFSFIVLAVLQGVSSNMIWRVAFGFAVIPAVIHFVLALVLRTESPKWLFLKGDLAATQQALLKLRGTSDVSGEMQQMMEEQKEASSSAQSAFFSSLHVKPLFVSLLLHFFQQATAFNAILYYLKDYLIAAGLSGATVPL